MVAAVSNDNEVLIDVAEATKHLRLLGYKDNDPVIFVLMENYYHPETLYCSL